MKVASDYLQRILFAVFVTTLLGTGALAQSVDEWSRYRSSNGKLTFSLPSIDVVISVEGRVEIYSYPNDAQLMVQKLKGGNAKDYVKSIETDPDEKTSVRTFTVANFLIKEVLREDENGYRVSYHIAYGGDYYYVAAVAKKRHDSEVSRFLKSVGIAGRSILKPDETREVSGTIMEGLQTSKIANDALRKVCRNDVPVAYDEKGAWKKSPPTLSLYSRGAVMVGLAHPDVAEVPRVIKMSRRKVVELRVILQADGCIGPIVVLEGAKDRESYAAIMAAIRSRFLPAQINGKPADSAVTIFYEFGGY